LSQETPYLSCSAQAYPNVTDSCCTETFGGLVLSTQFWDTYTGLEFAGQVLPLNTWTLHGLWPDFCNGSYTQYCDLNRQYDPIPSPNTTTGTKDGTPVPPYKGPSISTFLEPFGKLDLLAYMNKYVPLAVLSGSTMSLLANIDWEKQVLDLPRQSQW
jgi:ribonuclease T2